MAYEWIDTLAAICHVISDPSTPTSHSRDIDDNKFVDCAIGAKADYLVTGDADLTGITRSFSFKILTPIKFLSKLK